MVSKNPCYTKQSYCQKIVSQCFVTLFSGITLSSSHQSETWDPEVKAEYPRSNKLLIRQALLGPEAKADEFNVVQVNLYLNNVIQTFIITNILHIIRFLN